MRSRPGLVRHRVAHAGWGLPELRIAVLSDLHVCRPWTPLGTVAHIVRLVNSLAADLILVPGDFIADRNLPAAGEPAEAIVRVLSELSAPLGVAAVLGNHDWWDCRLSHSTKFKRNSVAEALAGSPIRLLTNEAMAIGHGAGFWLVGIRRPDKCCPFGNVRWSSAFTLADVLGNLAGRKVLLLETLEDVDDGASLQRLRSLRRC